MRLPPPILYGSTLDLLRIKRSETKALAPANDERLTRSEIAAHHESSGGPGRLNRGHVRISAGRSLRSEALPHRWTRSSASFQQPERDAVYAAYCCDNSTMLTTMVSWQSSG